MSTYDAAISAIGAQQSKVADMQDALAGIEDPGELLTASLKLMQEQQKLSIMDESYTKGQKVLYDSQKACIDNMH